MTSTGRLDLPHRAAVRARWNKRYKFHRPWSVPVTFMDVFDGSGGNNDEVHW